MRILIISQYFWPESFRINDIAQGLLERGHDVIVLTGKPNYPNGNFYEGYSFFGKPNEEWNGLNIFRVPLIARGRGSGIRLFMNYISFAVLASFRVLWIKKNFDSVLVYGLSPVTVGIPAVILKKLFKKQFHFWVQDLWPASLTAAGGIKNRLVIGVFERITRMIYNSSSTLLVQSKGFIPYVTDQIACKKKIHYLPNSTESFGRVEFSNKLIEYNIPERFTLLFAGNIGSAQSFETLLCAAKILKDRNRVANWIILGDGRIKEEVVKQVELLELSDCFFLLGRFPVTEMPAFYTSADVLILSLKKADIFSYTIPSKLQSYMAFGKPIIASLDGEGGNIIRDANAGFVSPAEDPLTLAENIILAQETDKKTMDLMGLNAVNYYKKEFDRESVLNNLENILQQNLKLKS